MLLHSPPTNTAPLLQQGLHHPCRHSSALIGTSKLHSAFHTVFSVATLLPGWVLLNHLLDLNYECLNFIANSLPSSPFGNTQYRLAALLDRYCTIPVGTLWPGFMALSFILRFSNTIVTPRLHLSVHIRYTSFSHCILLFLPNSSFCRRNSILIPPKLTCQFEPFRCHKSSLTTFKFNLAHMSGPNHSEILGVSPASIHH